MAKKIRLGFEFSSAYNALDSRYCSCDNNNHFNYVRYFSSSRAIMHRNTITSTPAMDKPYRDSYNQTMQFSYGTAARTKGIDGQGGFSYVYNNQYGSLCLRTDNINEGIYLNYWQSMTPMHTVTNGSSYGGAVLFSAFNGVDSSANTADNTVHICIAPDSTEYLSPVQTFPDKRLYIYANGSILAESELLTIPLYEYVNVKISLNNSGVISGEVNGKSVSYDLKNLDWVTDGAFDMWETLNVIGTSRGDVVDDLAINDGSGSEDNGMPGEIKCYAAEKSMQYISGESSGVTNDFNSGENPLDEVGVLTDTSASTLLELDKGGNLKFSIKAEDFLPDSGHGMIDPEVSDLFCYLPNTRVSTTDQVLVAELVESSTNNTASSNHYLSLTSDEYNFNISNMSSKILELTDELVTINLRYT